MQSAVFARLSRSLTQKYRGYKRQCGLHNQFLKDFRLIKVNFKDLEGLKVLSSLTQVQVVNLKVIPQHQQV